MRVTHQDQAATRAADDDPQLDGELEQRLLAKTQELAHAVDDLAETDRWLEKQPEAYEEYFTRVDHELRTSLATVTGFAEILEEQLEAFDLRDAARTIRRNADHMLGLLEETAAWSHGKDPADVESISPREITAEVAGMMQVRAAASDNVLALDCEVTTPRSITVDRRRLRRIMLQLVDSALRFTRGGTVILRTGGRDAPHGGVEAFFEVVDDGVGMTPENRAKLLAPYIQSETKETKLDETQRGCDVTLAKQLAESLGGRIDVRGAFGRGSVFTLTLPRQATKQNEAGKGMNLTVDEIALSEDALTGAKVLLADDSLDNQRLYASILRGAGADVIVVDDGAAAFDVAIRASDRNRGFDLVLMDLQMPRLDGYEATRRLRQAGYDGVVAALTAHAPQGARRKCSEAGFDECLMKPVRKDALVATACRLLQLDQRSASEAID